MMKVLMIVRTTFYTAKGGDTVQVLQTAEFLRKQGLLVDIKLTSESMNYQLYHFLHFFNIIRPADVLYHIRKANKPFFISTILVDYSEYDKYHRKGLGRIIFSLFNSDGVEYIKTISRWLLGKDRLMSPEYLWKGQRNAITEVLNKASLLLPNSHSEFLRINARYPCNTAYVKVPNGVNTQLFAFNSRIKKDPVLVLCVARIEGIKNQYNLIKALNNTQFQLLIIGSAAPNQFAYYQACRNAAGSNVHFIEHLPQEELVAWYQKASVHVLPSWFETTGLSSLEAAVMGCNIVVTDKGDTREYFGDHALYCEPGSPDSIYQCVANAAGKTNDGLLQQKIHAQYTWQQATERTMEAYKLVKQK